MREHSWAALLVLLHNSRPESNGSLRPLSRPPKWPASTLEMMPTLPMMALPLLLPVLSDLVRNQAAMNSQQRVALAQVRQDFRTLGPGLRDVARQPWSEVPTAVTA